MNDLGRCSQKAMVRWYAVMFHLGTARSGAQARATHYQRSNRWYKGPQKKGKWSKYPQQGLLRSGGVLRSCGVLFWIAT